MCFGPSSVSSTWRRRAWRPSEWERIRLGEAPEQSFEELRAALQVRRPGDRVLVVYLRDGEDRTAQAVLGERP